MQQDLEESTENCEELNRMLTEYLESESNSIKMKDAIEALQSQLNQQQTDVVNMKKQLKESKKEVRFP